MSQHKNSVWLRIIQINDVYELKNFSHFKTLVDYCREGPDKTLVVLAGDFLGPSLLSSLDGGRGMVDTMNACGITHVCFGNHVRSDIVFWYLLYYCSPGNMPRYLMSHLLVRSFLF
jgi:hypothetical protein